MLILNCIVFMCQGGVGKVCFSHQLYISSTNEQQAGEFSQPVQPRKQQRCYAVSCQDTQSSASA